MFITLIHEGIPSLHKINCLPVFDDHDSVRSSMGTFHIGTGQYRHLIDFSSYADQSLARIERHSPDSSYPGEHHCYDFGDGRLYLLSE